MFSTSEVQYFTVGENNYQRRRIYQRGRRPWLQGAQLGRGTSKMKFKKKGEKVVNEKKKKYIADNLTKTFLMGGGGEAAFND